VYVFVCCVVCVFTRNGLFFFVFVLLVILITTTTTTTTTTTIDTTFYLYIPSLLYRYRLSVFLYTTMSDRRRTLQPLTSSSARANASTRRATLGGRKSLAPGGYRPSLGGRPSNMGGRSSMGGRRSSVGRRKSMMNSRASLSGRRGRKLQDPRPIGQKAYHQQNKRVLIEFLTSHNYDLPISPKMLSAPTKKDFQHIIVFLLQQIDENFEPDENRFEDDIRTFLMRLNYPFNISKSNLVAVGSPHTWPTILACLTWIIELIQYNEVAEDTKEPGFATDINEKMFFNYLHESYLKFLEGHDNFSVLEADFADAFAERTEAINGEVERYTAENEQLRTAIQRLQSSISEIPNLESHKATLLSDRDKFIQHIETLQKHLSGIQKIHDEKAAERQEKESGLEEARLETELLEKMLDEQEFSPSEVERMHKEKSMLEDMIANQDKQTSEAKQSAWDLEMDNCKTLERVEKLVEQFNVESSKLLNHPDASEYLSSTSFDLKLDADAESPAQMLSVDLDGIVKPCLQQLRQEYQDRIRACQDELRDAEERVQQYATTSRERQEEIAELRARVKKHEDVYRTERDNMNKELSKNISQVEDIELELLKLKSTGSNSLAQSEKTLQQLEYEMQQQLEIMSEERDIVNNEICEAMELLSLHKAEVGEMLSALEERGAAAIRECTEAE
jgi:kinetochore protein NDC80